MSKSFIASLLIASTCIVAELQSSTDSAASSHVTTQQERNKSLFDFTSMKKVNGWIVVNDGVMGGKSKGGFKLNAGSLLFSGATNTDGGGFSSIRGALPKGTDLTDAAGIVLHLRTTGERRFKIDMRQSGSARARALSYRAPIKVAKSEAWQEVRVPFSAFAASWRGRAIPGATFNPEAATQLGFFIYDGQDGPFRLEIKSISTYKAME